MKLILAASGALLLYLGGRSLGWPLIHDGPLMHYIAWLIAQGAVPYRDVFDMNLPGVYLIHSAVLVVGGAGDLAWRLFDLGWTAATCFLLWAFCRPASDRWGAAAASLVFALYHLAGGAWRVGQRDFLLCLFLIAGAYGVARGLEGTRGLRAFVLAGLALGAGMTVKPHAGLFWAACVAAAALAPPPSSRRALSAAAAVLASGLVPPLAVVAWLAWLGGLPAFVSMFTGYVLPLYGQIGRDLIWEAIGWQRYAWQLWVLLLVLVVLALMVRAPEPGAIRRRLALMGAGYGILHFGLQGKGWEYHLYPLALFLCALAPTGLSAAHRDLRVLPAALRPLHRGAAMLALALAVGVLGVKGVEALEAPWIIEKARRVAALSRDLRPLLGPGVTMQTMDVTEGGIHALFTLRVRQPTRFIYDLHFFHDESDPRIQALRAEFVRGIESGHPSAIVVFRDTWRRPGYERMNELPALAELIERRYVLHTEGDGYRVYAKRAGS